MFTQVEILRDPWQSLELGMQQSVEAWGGMHTLAELRAPIQASSYYEKLVNLDPRFASVYDGFIDPGQFTRLVGQDVIPQQHGPFQAITVATPMLDAQKAAADLPQLPEELEPTFIAHHVQHDDHEGEEAFLRHSTKDIAHLAKTEQSRIDEFELWCKIHREIFGQTAELELEKVKRLTAMDFWEVSERIGYYASALQFAFAARNTRNLSRGARNRLQIRSAEISLDHRTFLEQHRATIALADTVLGQTTAVFKTIQDWNT